MALRQVERCPTTTSRLISRPTTKKKTAIRPSLIQWSQERTNLESFQEKPSLDAKSCRYESDHGEFAQPSATSVQMSSRMLPVASDWKNRADPLCFPATAPTPAGKQSASARFFQSEQPA